MIPVAGKLWCSYANNIIILNPITLNSEVSQELVIDLYEFYY
jgi:hypothetical protein